MTLKKQTIKKLVLQKKLYFYAGFGILVTVFGIILSHSKKPTRYESFNSYKEGF